MSRYFWVMSSLLLMACETPYNKDDLALNIEAYSKDGECRLTVEGMDVNHVVVEQDVPLIIDAVKRKKP